MSNSKLNNQKDRARRIRKRIRKKISGTEERPRVFVFKSNRYIYLQAVDDINGRILATASTLEKTSKQKAKGLKISKPLSSWAKSWLSDCRKSRKRTSCLIEGFILITVGSRL